MPKGGGSSAWGYYEVGGVTDEWTVQIADYLCAVWGWLPGDPEALKLGQNLAYSLGALVGGTGTAPETLLRALMAGVDIPGDEE